MKDLDGVYIAKVLKKWVSRYNPPSNGKSRLLWLAAYPAVQPRFHPEQLRSFNSVSSDWSSLLFQRLRVPTFQTSIPISSRLI